jgi:hypothetical protein
MAPPHNAQLAPKEGRTALAVQAYKAGQFSSSKACADAYDISDTTLGRRVKGIHARCDSVPINRKLTQTEEIILVEWILSMDQRGLAPTSDTV